MRLCVVPLLKCFSGEEALKLSLLGHGGALLLLRSGVSASEVGVSIRSKLIADKTTACVDEPNRYVCKC